MGKRGLLVDPGGALASDPATREALVFATVDDALAASERWVS